MGGKPYRHHGDGQKPGPKTGEHDERTGKLPPVVDPRAHDDLAVENDAGRDESRQDLHHVGPVGIAEHPPAQQGIGRVDGDVKRRKAIPEDLPDLLLGNVGEGHVLPVQEG